MEQQWQSYSDITPNRQTRYSHSAHATPQQQAREFNGAAAQQQQPPAGFIYESYQAPSNPSLPHSMATSPSATPHVREYNGDGDIAMEDADPYNRMKYSSRPNHQHRVSGQYLSHEESSAARRYSPMNTLSPSSPYAASPQQAGHTAYGSYTAQTHPTRQSPTRSNPYTSQQQSYYPSPSRSSAEDVPPTHTDLDASITAALRQQSSHLPPIQPNDGNSEQYYPQSATAQLNAVFGREARSPRHTQPQQQPLRGSSRGPVPRFRKLKNPPKLEPRINAQPAFRRADPEGGFISV